MLHFIAFSYAAEWCRENCEGPTTVLCRGISAHWHPVNGFLAPDEEPSTETSRYWSAAD